MYFMQVSTYVILSLQPVFRRFFLSLIFVCVSLSIVRWNQLVPGTYSGDVVSPSFDFALQLEFRKNKYRQVTEICQTLFKVLWFMLF